jgi:hypothetical protein
MKLPNVPEVMTRPVKEILEEIDKKAENNDSDYWELPRIIGFINTDAVANREQEEAINQTCFYNIKTLEVYALISMLNSLHG